MNAYAGPPPLPVDVRLTQGIANAVFVLVAVALLVAGVLWLVRLPVFAVRAIKVEGDLNRNSVSTIRANAMPRLAGTFFTVDLAKSRAAFEQVPWVRRAVVHREWPNRLRVQIEEHKVAALWQQPDGNERLVDEDGEVFEANVGDVEDDGLPTLSGPEGSSPRVLQMYRRLQPSFQRLDAGLDSVSLSAGGSWRAELDTGATIEMGRGDEPEVVARVERFVRTVTQVTGRLQHPLEHADLRHVDGYAVKLKGVTTSPAATDRTRKH